MATLDLHRIKARDGRDLPEHAHVGERAFEREVEAYEAVGSATEGTVLGRVHELVEPRLRILGRVFEVRGEVFLAGNLAWWKAEDKV